MCAPLPTAVQCGSRRSRGVHLLDEPQHDRAPAIAAQPADGRARRHRLLVPDGIALDVERIRDHGGLDDRMASRARAARCSLAITFGRIRNSHTRKVELPRRRRARAFLEPGEVRQRGQKVRSVASSAA